MLLTLIRHLHLPPTLLLFASFSLCFLLLGGAATQPKTDPHEASALNSIFNYWSIFSSSSKVPWNISGDICSGAASDFTSLDDSKFNPGIKCNCSFSNGTVCHIIEIKVVQLILKPANVSEDLKNLTKLSRLQLPRNYLSGALPPFIGNMTTLQHLNLSSNLLSGNIPRELGSLQNLQTLDLSINSFSGTLPEELGKLVNLQKMYLSSLGVNGQIPATFAGLEKLQILWLSDNNFSGMVPDFVGNFKLLTELKGIISSVSCMIPEERVYTRRRRMQGNSFQGPIPPSFNNLTKLTRLQIGELVNSSSTLAFMKDMKSLNILVVRNTKISGSIPSDLGNYTKLEHLDLSFNNLSGQIPDSLFNLPSLEYLFLGNNSLSGTLPLLKSTKLLNMDLSYNYLSGGFPSWISERDLNINLVGNNFNNSKDSNFSGLRCLQRDIPCGHGSPSHSRFAINCGGSQAVTSPNGPGYEIDGKSFTSTSYFVTADNKWAVSGVGRFLDVRTPSYSMAITSRFSNTPNSELYQDTRLSPSSLRYYGLGLENGNYTVKLSFGETLDWDVEKGRRFFDIIIQGVLVAKDFDITKEAGGLNLAAVERNYTSVVTSNFLEIHLFWAGRGTCCIPSYGNFGPTISALSVTADFKSTVGVTSSSSSSSSKNKALVIMGIVVAITALFLACIAGIFIWRRKGQHDITEDEELLGLAVKPNIFSYSELRTATGDFHPTNELGKGGFGSVYKGILSDGKEVAVKQLAVSSLQGKRQFVTEVATISSVQHRSLVKLHGCCCEGNQRLLVYEYMANGSLDQVLFEPRKMHIDWPARFSICIGAARGLAYLHEESSVRIVHRDVKASNILLDHELNPRISDFGLAKPYDEAKSHISTAVAGTVGYLAPEYAMRGQLTEKADVFAFGVVVLEILCGRRNTEQGIGEDKIYLLEWAWHLHEEKRDKEMVDPILTSYNEEEALRMIGVAFMCTQASPNRRPAMSRVVATLIGDMEVEEIVTKPSYLMEWKYPEGAATTSTSWRTQGTFPPGNLQTNSLLMLEDGR